MLTSIEYTNTLANGIAQYAKDADRKLENSMAIEASKIRAEMKDDTPDWEQNDSEGKGFIKNRPFYTEEPKTIIEDLGKTYAAWLNIVGDGEYTNDYSKRKVSFKINGDVYPDVTPSRYASDGKVWIYIINGITIAAGSYMDTLATSDDSIEFSLIKIITVKEKIHKIPEKYYDVPTKTSQLTNDSGYLTEHQSLEAYAKKTEIPTVPTSLKNPNVLTIKVGDQTYTYDGSEAVTIEIP